MKKLLSALLALSVLVSLTACGMKTESSLISTQQASAIEDRKTEAGAINVSENETSAAGLEKEIRQAFGKVLWDVYQLGMLPDGSKLDYASMEGAAENSFSISDIDGDGQDELLLCWVNACMAGKAAYVFGYQDGSIWQELNEFPELTFYDNGFVKANWSHSQGPGGDFQSYSVYRYHAENDTYQLFGGAQAWDRNYCENYELIGRTFPETIDADGDGIVYFIFPADWDGHYKNVPLVDGADYEQWSKSYLDGAEELYITVQKLTEANIAVLGYPKPDVPVAQPTG